MRISIFLAFLVLSACEIETDTECFQDNCSLIGDWGWIKTYGSIAGQTWTPDSTGDAMLLTIDKTYLTFRTNGTVTNKAIYQTFETNTMFRDSIIRSFISYDNKTRWLTISNDSLVMRDLCFDCFDDYFVRK